MAPETEKAELERKAALAERARLTDIGRHKVRWQLSDEQEAALVESNLSGAELGNRVLDIVADRDEATAISSFSDAATSYVEAGTTEHQKRASTVEEYILHLGWPHRKNPLTGKESGFKMTDGARQWSGYTMADLAREDRRCRGLSWKGLLPHQLEDMALIPITSEVPDDFQRFGGEGGGGMSPTDLPAAFGNVITKTLQASFSLKMKTYEVWTDRMVLPDFKQADIVKLGSAAQLLDVSDDGEYTYGYIGDRKERIWLVTGGRVVPVGRRFQVDDSLGILVSLPRRFGPNAKIRRNKMVYKLFFDNEVMLSTGLPMFDPGHANVIGAGAGVEASFADDASVGAMWDLVRQQRDQPAPGEEKGNKIDLVPEYIIHPSRQFQAWRKYLGRTNPTTTDEVVLEEYKGLRLLDEPELDDNDPNAWYMAVGADTGHAGVMTATLLGQGDGPQVMWKMGWNPRGVEMMISDDFGARPNEQRGIYRNAGA